MTPARSTPSCASCWARRSPSPPSAWPSCYPTVEGYLAAYEAATDASIAAGFALADDRDEILADAHPEVIPT